MHEFKSFDFNSRPPLSPLDQLLQNDFHERFSLESANGCFIPLVAQTGIGKTHSATALLIEQLLKNIQSELKGFSNRQLTYYITNSVDNVSETHEALLRLIDNQLVNGKPRFTDDQKQLLKSRVIYLPAQNSQLLLTDTEEIEIIFDAYDLHSIKHIQRGWKELQGLRLSVKEHTKLEAEIRKTLDEKASILYRYIVDGIQSRQRQKPPALNKTQKQALEALLPGDKVRSGKAEVLFMTTSKFFHGYHTSHNRIYPIRKLDKSLLIIDEIDRQNEIILGVLCQQNVRDLIAITRSLHANLDDYELEESPRYKGVSELFTPLRERLRDFANKWQIQYAFNTEGASFDDSPVRLFSDRTVTHNNSASHRLYLKTNPDLRKNIIVGVDKKSYDIGLEHSARLSQFANEADWIYRNFLSTMRKAIWKVIDNENTGQKNLDGLFQEAVLSLLSHFNLSSFRNDVFASFDTQLKSPHRGKKKRTYRMAQRSYHDTGLKMIDIGRDEGIVDTVSCRFHGLPLSPSGLLAQMVDSGARIIGISATATSPSVIKNFDLNYLRTRLGKNFIELNPLQKKIIGEYYQSRRQYELNNIDIAIKAIAPNIQNIEQAIENYEGHKIRQPGTILQHYLGKSVTDNSNNHSLIWVSKVLSAIEEFAHLPSNRYMTILLNRTIKPSLAPAFKNLLYDHLRRIGLHEVQIFLGLDAESMRDGLFQEIQSVLSTSSKKIIVFSTYASMGEGKNPDYPVLNNEDKDSLVWVGDGQPQEPISSDIDTIYLEKPTYQLLGSPENGFQDRLMKLHQIMCLQEAGWIAPNFASRWVFDTLKDIPEQMHLKNYYETDDSAYLIRKVVEQAVGRMARTAFKRHTIAIFADQELVTVIAADMRAHETLSHEYAAMTQAFREISESNGNDSTINSKREYNRAILHTTDTIELIQELVKGIHNAKEDDIENWEVLRLQLLRHPTIEHPSPSCPRLYISPPNKLPYAYQGNLDIQPDTGSQEWKKMKLFDQAEKPKWVGETESGLSVLMNNPIVKRHFTTHDFATNWLIEFPYVMTPAAFNNIYKGALGEEAIKAILQHRGFTIEPLPNEIYERFDFILTSPDGVKICIDVKHWELEGNASNHYQKADLVENTIGIRHFAYINTLGTSKQPLKYLDNHLIPSNQNATVLVIPGLIDKKTGDLLHENLKGLISWIGTIR